MSQLSPDVVDPSLPAVEPPAPVADAVERELNSVPELYGQGLISLEYVDKDCYTLTLSRPGYHTRHHNFAVSNGDTIEVCLDATEHYNATYRGCDDWQIECRMCHDDGGHSGHCNECYQTYSDYDGVGDDVVNDDDIYIAIIEDLCGIIIDDDNYVPIA